MNTKSLSLNVVLWFVALALAAKIIDVLAVNEFGDDYQQFNAMIVYFYYLFFAVWAGLLFKKFIYAADSGILKNSLHFVAFFALMGAGAALLVLTLFWAVAIATGTAP